MSTFDTPNISVGTKSNEENLQIAKGYLKELANTLNYKFDSLEERVTALEAMMSTLEGDNK